MKALRLFFSLVLICTGLLAVSGLTTSATGTPTASQDKGRSALAEQLRDRAKGSVQIETSNATRTADFIEAGRNGDLMPEAAATSPAGKAGRFLDEYGALVGAGAGTDLVRTASREDRLGGTHLTYHQEYRGVPVFGSELKVHLDEENDLTGVNGVAVPGIDLDVTPRLSAQQAADRAVAAVRSDPPTGDDGRPVSVTGVHAAGAELMVYRTGLIRDVPGSDQLVYRVEVTNGANIRDIVFVHAHAGKTVNRYSMVHDALNRELYEQQFDPGHLVWKENDPFPGTLTEDQQNIVEGTGWAYWLFRNAFGRDSYDGQGATMRSVNNDPRISCPNANWNGITTNYCNGVTSDDVVAHEWGHAYTEYTHDLIYQWQPGALNESYSDIWGEIVDQINGEQTDTPDVMREAGQCSTQSRPVPILLINSPAEIAGQCAAGPAQFGPPVPAAGLTGDIVQGLDAADDTGASTTDGCSPLTNAAEVAGKVAMLDRGTCAFTIKVKHAQDAGAVAAVIGNNVEGVGTMAGSDPSITIPSLMISLSNRNLIAGALADGSTVNVTLRQAGGERVDTVRWLMAEDSSAFGGAIRDMWEPTCLGDPGRVTDAEYHCSTDDGGGVHTNSGVPNHGFALLVDGGTYNGVTVPAIGMTKAAHVYWRAQSVYQTPTTDFADHADALDASCADLVGQPLTALSVAEDDPSASDEVISADDCAAIGAMAQAVELRTEPEQCNFQPLLDPNTPRLCQGKRNNVYKETFEDGLEDWTLSNQGVYAGWPGFDWEPDSSLPGGRSGTAAFGVDPRGGTCDQGAGDYSGVMRMESPEIEIPGSKRKSPRLTFDHYVATESEYDGGNVKISVNGGDYEVIPAEAYTFNAPGTLATADDGNTNPLAGQDAFSGSDGGEVFGSWGTSHVDLTMAGVAPGDTVQLRFDMGMDGCNGLDGWYVDDVTVSTCMAHKGKGRRD